ncbi:hypothetical protein IWZ00DRAFT_542556 [Phyllosticta capitalensis]
MEQLYQSLDAFQSRWIRLGVVPLLDQSEVEHIANHAKSREQIPEPLYLSIAEETNAVLGKTMPAVDGLAKAAGDDAELAKALKDYQDMVQRRRENLAMEEYHRLVERIGELTAEDEVEEDESACVVAESSTAASLDDPYDADDEEYPCENVSAPSTRATTPSLAWSDDVEKSSVSTNTSATSRCGSPNASLPTYNPWTGAKLLDRLVALPTAGEWKYSKFEQEEHCVGAEGVVQRLTMDTIFDNGLAVRGLVGRRP